LKIEDIDFARSYLPQNLLISASKYIQEYKKGYTDFAHQFWYVEEQVVFLLFLEPESQQHKEYKET